MTSTETWKQIVTQKITIDHERCIGCGNCLGACPFMVYEMREFKTRNKKKKMPVPVYLEDCFLCQSCQAECPTDAIAIEW